MDAAAGTAATVAGKPPVMKAAPAAPLVAAPLPNPTSPPSDALSVASSNPATVAASARTTTTAAKGSTCGGGGGGNAAFMRPMLAFSAKTATAKATYEPSVLQPHRRTFGAAIAGPQRAVSAQAASGLTRQEPKPQQPQRRPSTADSLTIAKSPLSTGRHSGSCHHLPPLNDTVPATAAAKRVKAGNQRGRRESHGTRDGGMSSPTAVAVRSASCGSPVGATRQAWAEPKLRAANGRDCSQGAQPSLLDYWTVSLVVRRPPPGSQKQSMSAARETEEVLGTLKIRCPQSDGSGGTAVGPRTTTNGVADSRGHKTAAAIVAMTPATSHLPRCDAQQQQPQLMQDGKLSVLAPPPVVAGESKTLPPVWAVTTASTNRTTAFGKGTAAGPGAAAGTLTYREVLATIEAEVAKLGLVLDRVLYVDEEFGGSFALLTAKTMPFVQHGVFRAEVHEKAADTEAGKASAAAKELPGEGSALEADINEALRQLEMDFERNHSETANCDGDAAYETVRQLLHPTTPANPSARALAIVGDERTAAATARSADLFLSRLAEEQAEQQQRAFVTRTDIKRQASEAFRRHRQQQRRLQSDEAVARDGIMQEHHLACIFLAQFERSHREATAVGSARAVRTTQRELEEQAQRNRVRTLVTEVRAHTRSLLIARLPRQVPEVVRAPEYRDDIRSATVLAEEEEASIVARFPEHAVEMMEESHISAEFSRPLRTAQLVAEEVETRLTEFVPFVPPTPAPTPSLMEEGEQGEEDALAPAIMTEGELGASERALTSAEETNLDHAAHQGTSYALTSLDITLRAEHWHLFDADPSPLFTAMRVDVASCLGLPFRCVVIADESEAAAAQPHPVNTTLPYQERCDSSSSIGSIGSNGGANPCVVHLLVEHSGSRADDELQSLIASYDFPCLTQLCDDYADAADGEADQPPVLQTTRDGTFDEDRHREANRDDVPLPPSPRVEQSEEGTTKAGEQRPTADVHDVEGAYAGDATAAATNGSTRLGSPSSEESPAEAHTMERAAAEPEAAPKEVEEEEEAAAPVDDGKDSEDAPPREPEPEPEWYLEYLAMKEMVKEARLAGKTVLSYEDHIAQMEEESRPVAEPQVEVAAAAAAAEDDEQGRDTGDELPDATAADASADTGDTPSGQPPQHDADAANATDVLLQEICGSDKVSITHHRRHFDGDEWWQVLAASRDYLKEQFVLDLATGLGCDPRCVLKVYFIQGGSEVLFDLAHREDVSQESLDHFVSEYPFPLLHDLYECRHQLTDESQEPESGAAPAAAAAAAGAAGLTEAGSCPTQSPDAPEDTDDFEELVEPSSLDERPFLSPVTVPDAEEGAPWGERDNKAGESASSQHGSAEQPGHAPYQAGAGFQTLYALPPDGETVSAAAPEGAGGRSAHAALPAAEPLGELPSQEFEELIPRSPTQPFAHTEEDMGGDTGGECLGMEAPTRGYTAGSTNASDFEELAATTPATWDDDQGGSTQLADEPVTPRSPLLINPPARPLTPEPVYTQVCRFTDFSCSRLSLVPCSELAAFCDLPEDKPPVLSHHHVWLRGSEWGIILDACPLFLRDQFTSETSELLGFPARCVRNVILRCSEESLRVDFDLIHDGARSYDTLDSCLRGHVFHLLMELYRSRQHVAKLHLDDGLEANLPLYAQEAVSGSADSSPDGCEGADISTNAAATIREASLCPRPPSRDRPRGGLDVSTPETSTNILVEADAGGDTPLQAAVRAGSRSTSSSAVRHLPRPSSTHTNYERLSLTSTPGSPSVSYGSPHPVPVTVAPETAVLMAAPPNLIDDDIADGFTSHAAAGKETEQRSCSCSAADHSACTANNYSTEVHCSPLQPLLPDDTPSFAESSDAPEVDAVVAAAAPEDPFVVAPVKPAVPRSVTMSPPTLRALSATSSASSHRTRETEATATTHTDTEHATDPVSGRSTASIHTVLMAGSFTQQPTLPTAPTVRSQSPPGQPYSCPVPPRSAPVVSYAAGVDLQTPGWTTENEGERQEDGCHARGEAAESPHAAPVTSCVKNTGPLAGSPTGPGLPPGLPPGFRRGSELEVSTVSTNVALFLSESSLLPCMDPSMRRRPSNPVYQHLNSHASSFRNRSMASSTPISRQPQHDGSANDGHTAATNPASSHVTQSRRSSAAVEEVPDYPLTQLGSVLNPY